MIFRLSIPVVLIAACCQAQIPVAPTNEPVGSVHGTDWHDYNLLNSFETGYRFVDVSGNTEKYRSDENFEDGVRLLSAFIRINSQDGHGALFDEIVFTANGLGGDPYESASLRVQKNRLYEYDLLWRRNDYFNPGLTTDGGHGEHLLNTAYTSQDHNLTLFPRSRVRLTLGYSRNTQDGAGISTVQLFEVGGPFNATGDVFPIFANIRRVQNDYRLGGEVHWLGLTLNIMHAWQDFKDDTPDQFNGFSPGDNPNNLTFLTSLYRSQPYHGTSPYWIAALFHEGKTWNVNGRFTYTGGVRAFLSNDIALGTNQLGAAANQQIFTFGSARRPAATGNVTVSVLPVSRLTIVSQTSFYNIRTDGNSAYLQFDNATQSANLLYFQYLGIRTAATATDVRYQLRKWLEIHGGYEYSDRRIASTQQIAFVGTPAIIPYNQTNELNSGNVGFRIAPLTGLSIFAEDEVGRASRPFTPKSDKNYNILAGRIDYRAHGFEVSASSRGDYNVNSVAVSSFSSHSRIYSASGSWNARSWMSFDAAYSKTHLDTLGGIAFFAESQLFNNQLSYYVSNIHSVTFTSHFNLKRTDLYVGYSLIQDTGDGRSAVDSTIIGPTLTAFRTAQTFPLKFQSPLVRLSIRISEKVRWNVGYQYFGYRENFAAGENYIANTGYTSVLWSF